jgi:hypothetical protein
MSNQNTYSKKDAIMTRGLAILSMVTLHLFCRLGDDVVFKPLIWISEGKPLVYWFGFFSEICVPLYSLSAGYAQYLLYSQNKINKKSVTDRILKLMINYWIVLVLFCILGLLFDREGRIPGNWVYFLESIFLLHSYNGIWWYLKTYIILLIIPASVLMFPVQKLNGYKGVIACFLIDFSWYFSKQFGLLSYIHVNSEAGKFLINEAFDLIEVLPYFWCGAILCKCKIFDKLNSFFEQKISIRKRNILLAWGGVTLFIVINIVSKAILIGPTAVVVFLGFNLMKKHPVIEEMFLFLGKHSTNIWLTHAFFYAIIFKDLIWRAKYPVIIIIFMLTLCIVTSYFILFVQRLIREVSKVRNL